MNAPLTLLVLLSLLSPFAFCKNRAETAHPPSLSSFSLLFEQNVGQAPASYAYVSRHGNVQAYFANDAIDLHLHGGIDSRATVQFRLLGQSSNTFIQPSDKAVSVSNYLVGQDTSRWKTGVPNYLQLAYRNVYPGVD